MDRLNFLVKKEIESHGRYNTLTRIKIGRYITAWSLIPFNMSIWMLPIGGFMQMSYSPKMWFLDKVRNWKFGRMLNG